MIVMEESRPLFVHGEAIMFRETDPPLTTHLTWHQGTFCAFLSIGNQEFLHVREDDKDFYYNLAHIPFMRSAEGEE